MIRIYVYITVNKLVFSMKNYRYFTSNKIIKQTVSEIDQFLKIALINLFGVCVCVLCVV